MRRNGLLVRTLVLAGLISSVMAVVVARVTPASDPAAGQAVLRAETTLTKCRDVLLVGIDGGAEVPASGARYGETVQVFHRAFATRAAAGERSVRAVRIPLTSATVASLVPSANWGLPGRQAVPATRAKAWRTGVGTATTAALQLLDSAATTCPQQQIVLVGYAQGASVAHRVLLGLRQRPAIFARVVGAALVSDPDRVANTVAGSLLGAPAAARTTSGLFPIKLTAIADVPAGTATFGVWNVCTRGDLVCNPNLIVARDAVAAARGYRSGDAAAAVRAAAAGLWSRTTLWPVPKPKLATLTTDTETPLSTQLSVNVDPSVADGVRWSNPAQVPPGVTLDANGRLSGTPTKAGVWQVTYDVRNTSPSTTDTRGVVVLTVAAQSGQISTGGQVSCQVRSDGTLRCWGRNSYGQLGDGSTTTRSTPVAVPGTTWESVSTSGATTCGIRTDHTLWCWGLNNYAQLGIGRTAPRTSPVQVGTGQDWASVSTSWFHSCGLRTDGTLWCWGQNLRGQLGDGTYTLRGVPTRIGTAQNWASVSTGGFHTCGTRKDGTAWCWGQNAFGQLGNATTGLQPAPVRVGTGSSWARVSAGWGHTCGLTTAGAASCWGLNNRGQLGTGTRTSSSAPVAVSGSRTWASISAADATTCAVDTTGAGYCWGSNRYGQLGNGTTTGSELPSPVPAPSGWAVLAAGWFHTCGTTLAGTTACWGNNEVGQLGIGTLVDAASAQVLP